MVPILKWAGGKRWLVKKHDALLRKKYKRYVEPFFGGGAVFFHITPRTAILSDTNTELIGTYLALRENPEEVWNTLLTHHKWHNKEYYYYTRNQCPQDPIQKAARFIYLNRTCFNGLYRVNLNGIFNVPIGTKNRVVFPHDNFSAIAFTLKNAQIYSSDFSVTISKAKDGDFLFVDPPYTVRHNNNNFLKYNERIFTWKDQIRLSHCLRIAAKRGAFILISNADHQCVRDLYNENLWQCLSVERFSRMASFSSHRKQITELVISNYLNKQGKQVNARY